MPYGVRRVGPSMFPTPITGAFDGTKFASNLANGHAQQLSLARPLQSGNSLSPTATAFTPNNAAVILARPNMLNAIKPPTGAKIEKVDTLSKESLISISNLVPTSIAEKDAVQANQVISQDGAADVADGLGMLTLSSSASGSTFSSDGLPEAQVSEPQVVDGKFTVDENVSRYIVIKRVPVHITGIELTKRNNVSIYSSLAELDTSQLASIGVVYMKFHSVADSAKAMEVLKREDRDWICSYVNPKDYVSKGDSGVDVSKVSIHEATILLTVSYNPWANHMSTAELFDRIRDHVSAFGALKAFFAPMSQVPYQKYFYIEYFDTRAAASAVDGLDNAKLESLYFNVAYHRPDVTEPTPPRTITRQEAVDVRGQATPTRQIRSGGGYASGGLVMPPTPRHQRMGVRPQINMNPRYANRNYDSYGDPNSNHNNVDLTNIANGIDVRTTIMVRNIPNNVDQTQLKYILDQTSKGQYDFMYLRIDFGNNKNVGYAFVNFAEPAAIIVFAQARIGERWSTVLAKAGYPISTSPTRNRVPGTQHDKVVAISYATIQGRDCLIQKFRNSSVMLEHPLCRPKLYIIGSGDMTGKEEEFPQPDNQSKMRRSVENAEHVGLFAPRAGQQYRDEQRRRRSQYDRGTTAAEMEARIEGHTDPARNAMAPPFFMAPQTQYQGFYNF